MAALNASVLISLLSHATVQSPHCDIHLLYDDHFSVVINENYQLLYRNHWSTAHSTIQTTHISRSTVHFSHTAVAANCRAYLLLFGLPESFKMSTESLSPVGSLWDQKGTYLVVSQLTPQEITSLTLTRSGTLRNLVYFYIATPSQATSSYLIGIFTQYTRKYRYLDVFSERRGLIPLLPPKVDFQRREVTHVSMQWPPAHIYSSDSGGRRSHKGLDPSLAFFVGEYLNFTFEFAETSDGGQFGFLVNGSWTGVTGDLRKGLAEVGYANYFAIYYAQAVEFSRLYDVQKICFASWIPDQIAAWKILVRPFSWQAWLVILFSLVVSTAVLVFISYMDNKEYSNFREVTYSFMYCFGGLVNEPHSIIHRNVPGQLFIAIWLVSALILSAGYTAEVFALMAAPPKEAPVDTAQDIYDTGLDLHCYGESCGFSLKYAANPVTRSLFPRYIGTLDYSTRSYMPRVIQRQAISVDSRKTIEYTIKQYFTDELNQPMARLTKECASSDPIAVGFPFHSYLTDLFTEPIERAKESGHTIKWHEQVIDAATTRVDTKTCSNCTRVSNDDRRPLTISSLEGVFYLLIVGWTAGAFAMVFEMIKFNVNKCR